MDRSFGLTGGIASGKSTVARFLEALGAKVIDADRVGHELLQPSNPVHNKVVAHFGREILKPCGEIDRERLGSIVFADPQKLSELTSLMHPSLIARVKEVAAEFRSRQPRAVILVDAPLIYEARVADCFQNPGGMVQARATNRAADGENPHLSPRCAQAHGIPDCG